MNLPQLLARLKELHERATPGPWKIDADYDVVTVKRDENEKHRLVAGAYSCYPADNDAAFIAAVGSALPLLLEVIETQREALKYYGSYKTYKGVVCMGGPDYEGTLSDDFTLTETEQQIYGKTARQAIARCEKVIQEGMK